MQRYRPDVFQKRFRLDKEPVRHLAEMYESAGFCKSTHAEGGGVGALDRVSHQIIEICKYCFKWSTKNKVTCVISFYILHILNVGVAHWFPSFMWAWHIDKDKGAWQLGFIENEKTVRGGGGVLKIKVYLTLTKVFRDNGKLLN